MEQKRREKKQKLKEAGKKTDKNWDGKKKKNYTMKQKRPKVRGKRGNRMNFSGVV